MICLLPLNQPYSSPSISLHPFHPLHATSTRHVSSHYLLSPLARSAVSPTGCRLERTTSAILQWHLCRQHHDYCLPDRRRRFHRLLYICKCHHDGEPVSRRCYPHPKPICSHSSRHRGLLTCDHVFGSGLHICHTNYNSRPVVRVRVPLKQSI